MQKSKWGSKKKDLSLRNKRFFDCQLLMTVNYWCLVWVCVSYSIDWYTFVFLLLFLFFWCWYCIWKKDCQTHQSLMDIFFMFYSTQASLWQLMTCSYHIIYINMSCQKWRLYDGNTYGKWFRSMMSSTQNFFCY